jgi:hypothetical protein
VRGFALSDPVKRMTIEERFAISDQRVSKRGYHPHEFRRMVGDYGHVGAIKRLLVPCGNHYHYGFQLVALPSALGGLDMPEESIESIVFFEYPEKFTEEEKKEAKRRLVDCELFERCRNHYLRGQ